MPIYKNNSILSEISVFFKKDDSNSALFTLTDMLKGFNMSEKVLFGSRSKCNSKYSLLQVLELLIMFPCFMIKNPYNYCRSSLSGFFGCEKDVFYRFVNNEIYDWRKILYHFTIQIWNKVRVRSDHKHQTVCLMVDDTDFPKTGRRIENIGRVYSLLGHKTILGFKSLFLGITDGKSQFILDFAILGEKGRKNNFSMSDKELESRFTKDRDEASPVVTRAKEYGESKIQLMITMIKRAIRKGIRFDYLLADSWFTCSEVIRFIRARHIKCHYLGMIKIGKKGVTKYGFEGKELTARALINLLEARGEARRSRKIGCQYITADVRFAGTDVRLYFVKRKKESWNGIMTTNLSLEFLEAYRIYAMRWSLEVFFKETKGLLGMGKCQSRNFAAQLAATTITALQYNLLSLAKRFTSYETIGGIFRDVQHSGMELSVTERIWGIILEMVKIMTGIFSIEEEEIFDAIINKSDNLAHFINFYELKSAS